MMKKWLACVLCCLLAALLPLSAVCESPACTLIESAYEDGKTLEATVSVVPGKELSENAMVRDLLNALVLRLSFRNDGAGALTLLFKELDDNTGAPVGEASEALTIAMRTAEDGLYIGSEALGEKPIYLATEDVQEMLQGLGQMQGLSFGSALGAKPELQADAELTDEELRAQLEKAFNGDAAMADAIMTIKARLVETEVTGQRGDHDPAVKQIQFTITQDDILAIMNTDYFRAQMEQSYAMQSKDSGMTADEAIAEAKDMISKSEISIPMTFLFDAEDDVVYMEYLFSGRLAEKDDGETEYEDVTMPVYYARKTGDTGVTHGFSMTGNDVEEGKEEPQVYVVGTFVHGNDGSLTGKVDIGEYDDGKEEPEIAINLDYRWNGNEAKGLMSILNLDGSAKGEEVLVEMTQRVDAATVANVLTLYMQKGVTVPMTVNADAERLITVNVDIAVADGNAAMDALSAAAPESAVRIAKLSTEELQSYLMSLQGSAMTTLGNLFSKLPKSLSNGLSQLLMGTLGN